MQWENVGGNATFIYVHWIKCKECLNDNFEAYMYTQKMQLCKYYVSLNT